MSIGLLSVTASVYQMLRGAEMLFAALFSVTFLKRSASILNTALWASTVPVIRNEVQNPKP